jgi:hypothetical protein
VRWLNHDGRLGPDPAWQVAVVVVILIAVTTLTAWRYLFVP